MNNPILLSDNKSESLVSTKELAEMLGVDVKTIQRMTEKLFDNNVQKVSNGGRPSMMFNEQQATLIKIELQNHSKLARNGFNTVSINNDLEMMLIKQKLSEYQNMRIQQLTNELNNANAQLIEQKPDVEFSKKIQSTKNVLLMREVAKVLELGYGDKTLFSKLVEMEILMKDHTPYQEYMNRGYFKVCISHHEENGELITDKTTKVYMKGCFFIAKKLGVIGKTEDICNAYGVTNKSVAESFMDKGEAEYHKIMDETAESFLKATDKMLEKELMHKAIVNNPESDKTIFNTYSLMQVAKLSGETVETIIIIVSYRNILMKMGNQLYMELI